MKSRIISFLLTLILGPLGLFYTTVAGAITMLVSMVLLAVSDLGVIVVWAVSIYWGDHVARKRQLHANEVLAREHPQPGQGVKKEIDLKTAEDKSSCFVNESGSKDDRGKRPSENIDLKTLSRRIQVPSSGQKGKLSFSAPLKGPCTTEDAFKHHAEERGWQVLRAEVAFWQAMFCLSFWEEIFQGMGAPRRGFDIPPDLFRGDEFYANRKESIEKKYDHLRSCNISEFINDQISLVEGSWTRLLYDEYHDMIEYSKRDVSQQFFSQVKSMTFAKIVYRIARNPSQNRSGVPDFVIWNDEKMKMVEVKRINEKIRPSQKTWLSWMVNEGADSGRKCTTQRLSEGIIR